MHLGNIYSLLCAWAHCRQQQGEMVLRIEDLDVDRCPRTLADRIIADLEWLGLDWDRGPYFQSERSPVYADLANRLTQRNWTFPCFCSRGELHAASAPHLSDGRYCYSGTCRNLTKEQIAVKSFMKSPSLRVKTDGSPVIFTDGHYGEQKYILSKDCGDFIIRRSDGVYAYHLAVVADDAAMGVTEIVRGADLLPSAAAQLHLYRLFDFTPPQYYHLPLLTAADGRRLAKRDGDLGIGALKTRFSPEEIIGFLTWQIGLADRWEKISAGEFVTVFDLAKLPRESIAVDVRRLER